tara:strand:+ start:733 stop:1101 length:369 start_codon:yes stop_codon:yes gene_type:complete
MSNNGENYLYFAEASTAAAATGAMYPASRLMGFESTSVTTGTFYFTSLVESSDDVTAGENNETVLVTFPTTATAGNLNFAQIAKIVAGAIQGNFGGVTVIADETNGEYVAPLTGTVTITAGA